MPTAAANKRVKTTRGPGAVLTSDPALPIPSGAANNLPADRCLPGRPGNEGNAGCSPDIGECGDIGDGRPVDHDTERGLTNHYLAGLPRLTDPGLLIPRFGPDTVRTIQVHDRQKGIIERSDQPTGKRKKEKPFRLGGRSQIVKSELIDSRNDGQQTVAVVWNRAQTITTSNIHAIPTIAEELLRGGVLQESDWCGSFNTSINRGLTRWLNETMGCGQLKVLGKLDLLYTDDTMYYSSGCRMHKWQEHFRARTDRPIGFFGLRFEPDPSRIYVKDSVLELEKAFPRYGYGLLHMLAATFQTTVAGYTFQSVRSIAEMYSVIDRDDFAEVQSDDLVDLDAFHEHIPIEACFTPFNVEYIEQVAATCSSDKKYSRYAWISAQVLELWRACRAAGKTFYTLNHMPFLSWEMHMGIPDAGMNQMAFRQGYPIDKLTRAPTCYTVWDEDDVMARLVDDYIHMCKQTYQYSELTWMHAFQVGHSGADPKGAKKALESKARIVRKLLKQGSDDVLFHDPEWRSEPLPDGSLEKAVTALKMCIRIIKVLDSILDYLNEPQTLMERARAGKL